MEVLEHLRMPLGYFHKDQEDSCLSEESRCLPNLYASATAFSRLVCALKFILNDKQPSSFTLIDLCEFYFATCLVLFKFPLQLFTAIILVWKWCAL